MKPVAVRPLADSDVDAYAERIACDNPMPRCGFSIRCKPLMTGSVSIPPSALRACPSAGGFADVGAAGV